MGSKIPARSAPARGLQHHILLAAAQSSAAHIVMGKSWYWFLRLGCNVHSTVGACSESMQVLCLALKCLIHECTDVLLFKPSIKSNLSCYTCYAHNGT